MPGVYLDLEATSTLARLTRVSERLWDMKPAFEGVMRELEHVEAERFAGFTPPGHYVDTGATRASLTQPSADGAIREAHALDMEFGTSIPYARFLRKPPVLVSASFIRRKVGAATLAYIAGHTDGRTRRAGVQMRMP